MDQLIDADRLKSNKRLIRDTALRLSWQGCTYQQIADHLGINRSTAFMHVWRAEHPGEQYASTINEPPFLWSDKRDGLYVGACRDEGGFPVLPTQRPHRQLFG